MDLPLFRNLEITFEQISRDSVAMYDFPFFKKSYGSGEKKVYCQTKSIAIEILKTKSSLECNLGIRFSHSTPINVQIDKD